MTTKTHSQARRHLQRWTRAHASRVTDRESIDLHTSDLGLDLPPTALVAACRQLFDDLVHARWPWLDDLLLMHDVSAPGLDTRCLWLLPITSQELVYKKNHGVEALEDAFERAELDYLNLLRSSVV